MKTYTVVFTPEAEEQLVKQYSYIEEITFAEIAFRYTNVVVQHCESLGYFRIWALPRHDVRAGLRTTPYKRRTVIAYTVETDRVSIIGAFNGGEDYGLAPVRSSRCEAAVRRSRHEKEGGKKEGGKIERLCALR